MKHDDLPYTEADLARDKQQIEEWEQHLRNLRDAQETFGAMIAHLKACLGRNMTQAEQVHLAHQARKMSLQMEPCGEVIVGIRDFCYEHVGHGCQMGTALVEALDMPPEEVNLARGQAAMRALFKNMKVVELPPPPQDEEGKG